LWIDRGGTFTDIVAHCPDGKSGAGGFDSFLTDYPSFPDSGGTLGVACGFLTVHCS